MKGEEEGGEEEGRRREIAVYNSPASLRCSEIIISVQDWNTYCIL